MPTIQPSEARTVFAPVEIERLSPLSNPKVPLHTRTKRSQRLLIIRTLIRRQSDLVAIELNHDRRLLPPSLESGNHAVRRHQQPRPKQPQRRSSQRHIVLHRRLIRDPSVRHYPITLLHIVPSLECLQPSKNSRSKSTIPKF